MKFQQLSQAGRRLLLLAVLIMLPGAARAAQPVATHPRLWVRQADLARLRARAVPSNPMYKQGFLPALSAAVATYNQYWPGGVPNAAWTTDRDPGITNWVPACTEAYAEFFAFASLIDNDPAQRADYAQRAHNMIMAVINEAAKGSAAGQPFRDPMFSTYNRANYWSEAFGLTVDWVYQTFTAQDKAAIRKVFLRWCDECAHASTTSEEHPQPVGMTNNPQLLSDLKQLRYAANNYFTGHMRHVTLMSLALDEADDQPAAAGDAPAGALRAYITQATGGWLYMQYAMYEDAATVSQDLKVPATGLGLAEGGLSAEGFMYGHALGYLHEALLALYTAGYGDPALSGPQIKLLTSKYWDNWIDGHLHSITPAGATPSAASGDAYLGPIYQMASYGDILRFWITPDLAAGFGSLGAYDQIAGNTARLAKTRWIVNNTLEGGPARRYDRAANIWGNADATVSIMNFMLFDPADPSPPDPRPALPTVFYSKPLGRILARTNWTPACSWFTFIDSWNSINHQNGCGGQFEFYRKGEWLTKEKSGYAQDNVGATPDFHNTLALMNDVPPNMQWYEAPLSARGGQWKEGLNAGDPANLASFAPDYVYAYADLTHLYNRPDFWTPANSAVDIKHASRSILWLKPDHIIVYDRARSGKAGRFKRFNLNLLVSPVIVGRQAVATMPSGQRLAVQNLLPAGATLKALPTENYDGVAELEPSAGRLVIEDPANPADIRFLNVLQGADAAAALTPATLLRGDSGTPFEGVVVRGVAALFPVDPAAAFTGLTYTAPAGAALHLIAGLTPGAAYKVTTRPVPGGVQVTIAPHGPLPADSGGVLAISPHSAAGDWSRYR